MDDNCPPAIATSPTPLLEQEALWSVSESETPPVFSTLLVWWFVEFGLGQVSGVQGAYQCRGGWYPKEPRELDAVRYHNQDL